MPAATMLGNIMGLSLRGGAILQPQPQLSARLTIAALNSSPSFSAYGWSMKATDTIVAFTSSGLLGSSVAGICRALVNFTSLIHSQVALLLQLPTQALPTQQFGVAVAVQGPKASIEYPPTLLGFPTTIAATTGFTTQVIKSQGLEHIIATCGFSGGGILSLQRYVDSGGLIPQGAAITATATAGAVAVIDNSDGKGFLSFTLNATNTASAAASLTSLALVMMSS